MTEMLDAIDDIRDAYGLAGPPDRTSPAPARETIAHG
jgi:hypothetical protein